MWDGTKLPKMGEVRFVFYAELHYRGPYYSTFREIPMYSIVLFKRFGGSKAKGLRPYGGTSCNTNS